MKINEVCKVMLRKMKWNVKPKSLETVAFKSLTDFQCYLAEYSRLYNVCDYMFKQTL
jgi:hypothetical protein